MWSRSQVFGELSDFFCFLCSSPVSSWLIHCSSSVLLFANSVWLRFEAKKLSTVQTCFTMWHVKDCQVCSPHLVEHDTYMFSRVWLKHDFRMNFKQTMYNIIHFPYFVLQCSLQFLYRTNSLDVCFLSSFFRKLWRGQIVSLACFFLSDNFNYNVGLVQWGSLVQTLL